MAERRVAGECRAILVTRALDGWAALESLLVGLAGRAGSSQRRDYLSVCAGLIGKLHASGLRHGCLYPKHLFLQEREGRWQACLIDLEKTRRLWFGWRDQVRDLETFLRKVRVWEADEQHEFLAHYLQASGAAGLPGVLAGEAGSASQVQGTTPLKLGELCAPAALRRPPLSLQLPGGELLVSHWLRVLPGKRYVGQADWRGRPVLAKLLVGRKAERQFRRERDGAGYLAAQGVATPALLESGYRPDSGGWLLFDFLEGAQSLGERLACRQS